MAGLTATGSDFHTYNGVRAANANNGHLMMDGYNPGRAYLEWYNGQTSWVRGLDAGSGSHVITGTSLDINITLEANNGIVVEDSPDHEYNGIRAANANSGHLMMDGYNPGRSYLEWYNGQTSWVRGLDAGAGSHSITGTALDINCLLEANEGIVVEDSPDHDYNGIKSSSANSGHLMIDAHGSTGRVYLQWDTNNGTYIASGGLHVDTGTSCVTLPESDEGGGLRISGYSGETYGNVGGNPLSVIPRQYATGTASQSGDTVTGSGTTWTSAMVGSIMYIGSTLCGTITGRASDTSMTVSTSQTVSSASALIYYSGLNVTTSGKVGIGDYAPSYDLDVNGTFYASGSSIDFKENVTDMSVDSSVIYGLHPVSYDYKEEHKNLGYHLAGGKQIGLVSEEVADAVPELAIMKNGKPQNVDYQKLSVLLLAELKNINKRLVNLEDSKK